MYCSFGSDEGKDEQVELLQEALMEEEESASVAASSEGRMLAFRLPGIAVTGPDLVIFI